MPNEAVAVCLHIQMFTICTSPLNWFELSLFNCVITIYLKPKPTQAGP